MCGIDGSGPLRFLSCGAIVVQTNEQPDELDAELEAAILALLQQRGAGMTICPSEAARKVAPEAWEPLMERARAAARRLVAAGEITITQSGVVVDPANAKGPIRLRGT